MSNYKIQLPLKSAIGRVSDSKRINKSETRGSRTKFKIAVVKRRTTIVGPRGGKTYGRKYFVVVDPRRDGETDAFSSPEVYELTGEQISALGMNHGADKTAIAILESPVNKVNFRWLSRDTIRELRHAGAIASR